MLESLDLRTAQDLAIALLIGALIGTEREKRKGEEQGVGIGGVRTFILFAEIGAVSGLLARELGSMWILAAALIGVSAMIVAGYIETARARPGDVGLTTETAALAVVFLGALTTLGHREAAIGLAVITAAVLAYKQPLHGLVAKLGWDDVYAGMRLAIATFIVLPFLPDRTVDPWGALNPRSLWLLVLLISSLSLVGYVATRILGARKGTALTGIAGGLVSSTAVTLSFAREGREVKSATAARALAAGIVLAWAVMFARIVAEVLVVNPSFARTLALPFVALGAAAGGLAWVFFRQSSGGGAQTHEVPLKNPFSLTRAAQFALLFALVKVVVTVAQAKFHSSVVYVVAVLAGLTDVDAITLSMAEYAKTNDPDVAARAIVLAAASNTIVKCGLVVGLGGAAMKRPVMLAAGVLVAVAALSTLLV